MRADNFADLMSSPCLVYERGLLVSNGRRVPRLVVFKSTSVQRPKRFMARGVGDFTAPYL